MAGTWCTNLFGFKPQLTTQGTTDKADFDTSMDRIDAKLGNFKVVGDPGYDDIPTALTAIGSTPAVLSVGPNNVQDITTAITVPANVFLADGPYQIFNITGGGSISLKNSPTTLCPIEWWGGEAGTSNDCYAAMVQAMASVGRQQDIFFSLGWYRIASPLTVTTTLTDYGFGIRGSGWGSAIYIDVGAANNGITFVAPSYQTYRVKDIAFIGPTNCCKNGVVVGIDSQPPQMLMDNIQFKMGATDFALRLQGTTYSKFRGLNIGHYDNLFAGCVDPVSGVAFVHPPSVEYGNNAIDMEVNISGCDSGYGIYMVNASSTTLRGSIEDCLWPLYIDGMADALSVHNLYAWTQFIKVDNMYMTDLNVNGPYIANTINFTMDNGNNENFGLTELVNTLGATIRNGRFSKLKIHASCQQTVLDNVGVQDVTGSGINDFINEAPDTICTSPVYSLYFSTVAKQVSNPSMVQNILSNTDFTTWTAGTVPDGWAVSGTLVATKCGIAQLDTTCHNAEFSTKLSTTGSDGDLFSWTLTAPQLQQLLGKYATFSMWINAATLPATFDQLDFTINTLPAWAGTTTYKIGQCVKELAEPNPLGLMFKCVEAGTSGGTEPTWAGPQRRLFVDGTVTWQMVFNSQGDQKLATTDVGEWRQLAVSGFVPLDATSLRVGFITRQGAGAADVDYYVAEPCLTPGGWAPNFYVPGA